MKKKRSFILILELNSPALAAAMSPREEEFILKIKSLFEEQILNPDFGLDILSRELNLSRSQVGRKIKALTGQSTTVFIRSLRLQKAKHLLLTTDLSVKEVGYDVGFTSPSYFSRTYSKEFGEPPANTWASSPMRNR